MAAVRDPQQALSALNVANRVRIARARVRHDVNSGTRSAGEVIVTCPDEVTTMTVYDLLCAQRFWGKCRARKLLAVAQITEGKTIGSLTDRQRTLLYDLLTWNVA